MRFLHLDPAPVIAHLRDNCSILMLEWEREPLSGGFALLPMTRKKREAEPARPVDVPIVEEFARRKKDPRKAAQVLHHYFHVNSSAPPGRPMSLVEGVGFVESLGQPGEFLLAGYIEGGLVSVSREPLPFQHGLKPVTWWGP